MILINRLSKIKTVPIDNIINPAYIGCLIFEYIPAVINSFAFGKAEKFDFRLILPVIITIVPIKTNKEPKISFEIIRIYIGINKNR